MKNFIILIVAALVSVLTGCASVPMASMDQDAQAKGFTSLPDKANLYIFRDETMGAALPLTVSVNSKTLGQTASMTYFRLNLAPGKSTISSLAEDVSTLNVDLSAGSTCFVWQEIKMGMFSARSKLQQVDETRGKAGVMRSKMIASAIQDSEFSTAISDLSEQKATNIALSTTQKIRDLQSLKNEGVITNDEFEQKKKILLDNL